MSEDNEDDKVTNIPQKSGSGGGKLLEAFDKEWRPKLEEQRKKAISAVRISVKEKQTLSDMLQEYEEERTLVKETVGNMG